MITPPKPPKYACRFCIEKPHHRVNKQVSILANPGSGKEHIVGFHLGEVDTQYVTKDKNNRNTLNITPLALVDKQYLLEVPHLTTPSIATLARENALNADGRVDMEKFKKELADQMTDTTSSSAQSSSSAQASSSAQPPNKRPRPYDERLPTFAQTREPYQPQQGAFGGNNLNPIGGINQPFPMANMTFGNLNTMATVGFGEMNPFPMIPNAPMGGTPEQTPFGGSSFATFVEQGFEQMHIDAMQREMVSLRDQIKLLNLRNATGQEQLKQEKNNHHNTLTRYADLQAKYQALQAQHTKTVQALVREQGNTRNTTAYLNQARANLTEIEAKLKTALNEYGKQKDTIEGVEKILEELPQFVGALQREAAATQVMNTLGTDPFNLSDAQEEAKRALQKASRRVDELYKSLSPTTKEFLQDYKKDAEKAKQLVKRN